MPSLHTQESVIFGNSLLYHMLQLRRQHTLAAILKFITYQRVRIISGPCVMDCLHEYPLLYCTYFVVESCVKVCLEVLGRVAG